MQKTAQSHRIFEFPCRLSGNCTEIGASYSYKLTFESVFCEWWIWTCELSVFRYLNSRSQWAHLNGPSEWLFLCCFKLVSDLHLTPHVSHMNSFFNSPCFDRICRAILSFRFVSNEQSDGSNVFKSFERKRVFRWFLLKVPCEGNPLNYRKLSI